MTFSCLDPVYVNALFFNPSDCQGRKHQRWVRAFISCRANAICAFSKRPLLLCAISLFNGKIKGLPAILLFAPLLILHVLYLLLQHDL